MGDEVRITVIATGFDRWDDSKPASGQRSNLGLSDGLGGDGFEGDDDDFDVPPFLK